MSEVIREELEQEEEYAVPQGWVCDSDAKAEWCMKKINEARSDRDRMVAWYKNAIATIERQTDCNTYNLEQKLLEYFKTVPHKNTKTEESYTFPGGKLMMKKQQPEFKLDEDTVIAWLKKSKNERFVKVKETLDWAALKAACGVANGQLIAGETVNEDGEIVQVVVPGVEVIDREPEFVVK